MEPIRIGIIGVGQIGKSHVRGYQDIPGATIVAACDLNQEELTRVCDENGIPDRYQEYDEMLARDDIDAVDVCLHNRFHAPATIAGLKAGKNVYCEKPIASSYQAGMDMLDAAEASGKMLHIQLAQLYSKETRAARTLIEAGKLGDLYHARSTGYRRRGRPFVDGYGTFNFVRKEVSCGGALFDMGIYHISRLLYLLDIPEVERISGRVYQETEMDEARKKESAYDVEELAVGLVHFKGGLTMDIIEAWAIHMNAFEGSSISGSSGGIRLDPFSYHANMCDIEMDATFNLGSMDFRQHRLNADQDAYDSSQAHWIAALQGRVELLPTARIALQTMLIQEGIYLSHEQNRDVTAADVKTASA